MQRFRNNREQENANMSFNKSPPIVASACHLEGPAHNMFAPLLPPGEQTGFGRERPGITPSRLLKPAQLQHHHSLTPGVNDPEEQASLQLEVDSMRSQSSKNMATFDLEEQASQCPSEGAFTLAWPEFFMPSRRESIASAAPSQYLQSSQNVVLGIHKELLTPMTTFVDDRTTSADDGGRAVNNNRSLAVASGTPSRSASGSATAALGRISAMLPPKSRPTKLRRIEAQNDGCRAPEASSAVSTQSLRGSAFRSPLKKFSNAENMNWDLGRKGSTGTSSIGKTAPPATAASSSSTTLGPLQADDVVQEEVDLLVVAASATRDVVQEEVDLLVVPCQDAATEQDNIVPADTSSHSQQTDKRFKDLVGVDFPERALQMSLDKRKLLGVLGESDIADLRDCIVEVVADFAAESGALVRAFRPVPESTFSHIGDSVLELAVRYYGAELGALPRVVQRAAANLVSHWNLAGDSGRCNTRAENRLTSEAIEADLGRLVTGREVKLLRRILERSSAQPTDIAGRESREDQQSEPNDVAAALKTLCESVSGMEVHYLEHPGKSLRERIHNEIALASEYFGVPLGTSLERQQEGAGLPASGDAVAVIDVPEKVPARTCDTGADGSAGAAGIPTCIASNSNKTTVEARAYAGGKGGPTYSNAAPDRDDSLQQSRGNSPRKKKQAKSSTSGRSAPLPAPSSPSSSDGGVVLKGPGVHLKKRPPLIDGDEETDAGSRRDASEIAVGQVELKSNGRPPLQETCDNLNLDFHEEYIPARAWIDGGRQQENTERCHSAWNELEFWQKGNIWWVISLLNDLAVAKGMPGKQMIPYGKYVCQDYDFVYENDKAYVALAIGKKKQVEQDCDQTAAWRWLLDFAQYCEKEVDEKKTSTKQRDNGRGPSPTKSKSNKRNKKSPAKIKVAQKRLQQAEQAIQCQPHNTTSTSNTTSSSRPHDKEDKKTNKPGSSSAVLKRREEIDKENSVPFF
ncbi:unnamed protein product [Amoebophrya sp. A25]|nr:unnamed protein product [Amoebophrya sp. A25]|eukprot:GSA25T00002481001.1